MNISFRYMEIDKALDGIESMKEGLNSIDETLSIEDFHLRPFTSRGISNDELKVLRSNFLKLIDSPTDVVGELHLKPVEFDQLIIRNSSKIFEGLHPVDAFQSEVWSYLTIRVFPDFALWRWPNNAPERYFGNPERNAFQRLWHRQWVLGADLAASLQEDEAISIFERMEALGSNKIIARPLAKHIIEYRKNRSKVDPGSSDVASQVTVRLRRSMAVVSLNSMSDQEVESFVSEHFETALAAMSKDKNQNRSEFSKLPGEAIFSTVVDVHQSKTIRKYSLKLDGTIIDKATGRTLDEVIGIGAKDIGLEILELHPHGGRFNIESNGEIFVYNQGDWKSIGVLKAEKWFEKE